MQTRPALIASSLLLLSACGGGDAAHEASPESTQTEAAGAEASASEADAPEEGVPVVTATLEDGSRLFGRALDEEVAMTELSAVLAAPSDFEGQRVRTEGEIVRVCPGMGCWMELRASEDGPGIRIPMAGHSFFLPRDIAGRRATIEGTVLVAALSDEDRAHLEGEGATTTGQDVSIEATGVIVH